MNIRHLAFATIAVLSFATVACGGSSASEEPADQGALHGGQTSRVRTGGWVETFKGADHKDYFRVVAANGLKLLKSQAYTSEESARKTLGSLADAKDDADRFEILPANTEGYKGFYINVTGKNGSPKTIATSEVYSSESKAKDAVAVIRGYLKDISKDSEFEAPKSGERFEIFRIRGHEVDGSLQEYKWHLYAANGEAVLSSEWYEGIDGAKSGIESVRDNGRRIDNFKVMSIRDDQGVFSLVSEGNHHSIGSGEVYATKDGAQDGAQRVRDMLQHGASIKITDSTGE